MTTKPPWPMRRPHWSSTPTTPRSRPWSASPGATWARSRTALGAIEDGIGLITRAMEANKTDPQRFRNRRELAIAYFLAGRHDDAASAAARLVQQAPDLARNRPVLVSLLWHAGRHDAAGQALAALLREAPDFRLATARPVMFADDAAAERYLDGLRQAGAPE